MYWPRRGQLPLFCCIILIFSYYISDGLRMQKDLMIIKDKLEDSVTTAIVDQFYG